LKVEPGRQEIISRPGISEARRSLPAAELQSESKELDFTLHMTVANNRLGCGSELPLFTTEARFRERIASIETVSQVLASGRIMSFQSEAIYCQH
jgi:hypothetical protein